MFYNTAAAISDCNSAAYGICAVNDSTSNVPFTGNTTCMLLTCRYSSVTLQLCFDGSSHIWQRRKTSAGWQNWYSFTGTVVS